MNKSTRKVNYAAELKKKLKDVDFSKKPKKVSFEELKKLAKRARESREKDEYKSSLQPEISL